MSELILCNQPLSLEQLKNSCGITIDTLEGMGCSKPSALSAYTPYLLGEKSRIAANRSLLTQLSPRPIAKELTNLSLSFGSDNTIAIAEITNKLQEYNIGLMGAATSAYANRMGGFAASVKAYQDSLINYRTVIKSTPASKILAKQKAHTAFQKMQLHFKNELNVVTAQVKSRRGTPLTSADRAINIANSSRNIAKLNIISQVEANNLVKLSKHAKFLGNGLAVIDFTSRIGAVHNSYQAGGHWERELFIESSSFAASTIAGTLAVRGGIALLLAVTPAGWVGLIIGGLVVAGTAATVSIASNNMTKEKSGSVYDAIMKSMPTS